MRKLSGLNAVDVFPAAIILAVSLAVTPNISVDPVGMPKLFQLTLFSFSYFLYLISKHKSNQANYISLHFSLSILYIFLLAINIILSKSPITQLLFGVSGSNLGFITLLFFTVVFLGISTYSTKKFLTYFKISFFIVLLINIIYSLLQDLKLDPVNWVYGASPLIGTLGKPENVSLLLGIGIATLASYLISSSTNSKIRIAIIFVIFLAGYEIIRTGSVQGIIISIFAIVLNLFLMLRLRIRNSLVLSSYFSIGFIGGVFALFGSFNKGPLSSLLYSSASAERGDYWRAATNMIKENPFFGVGLDSYGDWYRSTRTLEATLRHGPSFVTNSAHNVFLDIAANSGLIALFAYLAIIVISLRAGFKIISKQKHFEPFQVAVFTAWIGYLVQANISTNNLEIGLWGWVLPGLLIAMERWSREGAESNNLKKVEAAAPKKLELSGLIVFIGLLIGGVIGFLPFNTDASFRHAMAKGDSTLISKSAYKWPQDTDRMIYIAQIYNHNGMPDEALKITKSITSFNPRNFAAWIYVYNANSTSAAEKTRIVGILRKLDPHNPELKK